MLELSVRRAVRAIGVLAIVMVASVSSSPAQQPGAASGTRFVYLVRHGDYARDSVADDRVQGALTPLGHEQAKLVAARLASLPVKFSTFVSSDFLRARETADDIGAVLHLAPVRDTLIHECAAASYRPPRDETAAEMALCDSNLVAAWAKYFTPSPGADAYTLLVCHGNVIRWLTCHAIGADTRRWPAFDIANGSLTIVAVRADGTSRLVTFSDSGHLPLAKQTWLGRGGGWTPAPAPASAPAPPSAPARMR